MLGCLLLAAYFVFKTVAEYKEMLQRGTSYFTDWYNYLEMLVQTLILAFFGMTVRVWM